MTSSELAFIAVALGGAVGAVLRHLVARAVALKLGHAAFGTLAVNISGALIIGGVAGIFVVPGELSAPARWGWFLFVTGILGSYTTVSGLSFQTLELVQSGRHGAALSNIAGSLIFGLAAAAIGFALSSGFLEMA